MFSFRVIYSHFCSPSVDARANRTGIQLLGVVVANRLPPYDPATSGSIDEQKFYSTFVALLSHKYRESYAAAAEVLGMTLAYMKDEQHVNLFPSALCTRCVSTVSCLVASCVFSIGLLEPSPGAGGGTAALSLWRGQ